MRRQPQMVLLVQQAGPSTKDVHTRLSFTPPACRCTVPGMPETDIVRVYNGYVTAYDYRTRNPRWVLEHITKESWTGEGTR